MLDFALAVLGLLILLATGDLLVRGAVAASLRTKVPPVLIGLTIVAFGTSSPELFVTIQSSLDGAPGLAVGNVIGSNIANILLVVGLPAILAPLGDSSTETRRNYAIMLGVTGVAIGLCFYTPLTWWQGALLLSLLALFLLDAYRCARAAGAGGGDCASFEEIEEVDPHTPRWKIAAMIGAGLFGLPLGAEITVGASLSLAAQFGISNEAIGLTLVALGTSLPELATTVMAAMRGRADMAIGNVIGSNVFNLLCILGVAATIDNIVIPEQFLAVNLWVMLAATIALAPFVFTGRKVGRAAGGAFVAAYAAYIALVLAPSGSRGLEAGAAAESEPPQIKIATQP